MIKKWILYLLAYLIWLITMLLALWIFLLARDVLPNFLAVVFENTFEMNKLAGFLDRAIALVLGIAWLVVMIVSEETYRTGVINRKLGERSASIVGAEFLVVFILDFSLFLLVGTEYLVVIFRNFRQLILQGGNSITWLSWIILSVELAVGLLLTWYARVLKTSRLSKGKLDIINNPG